MKAYWALFRARSRTLLQYRAAAAAGFATQVVFGLVSLCILRAFYRYAGASQPMTLSQAASYIWLGQALLGMQPGWSMDSETANAVRSGAVAYDLTRPLDMYAHWYVRALALRIAPTLLKSVPMFLFASLLLPEGYALVWPPLPSLLAWMAALAGALALSCSITLLMQATLFWTVAGDGVARILPSIILLLSGMVIPLPLFPDWAQPFLRIQPFYGLSGAVSMLFCQILPAREAGQVIALQWGWTAAFVLGGRWLMGRGLRRLNVAGG